MANMRGMDIEQIEGLAKEFDTEAEAIKTIIGRIDGKLKNAAWVGPDRERFLGDWSSLHCAALNRVVSGLHDAATKARINAGQQRDASGN